MTDNHPSTTAEEAALQALILDSDLERLEDLLAEFNLFDVLNIAGRELQHSAFIRWLLDPKGSHGLRDYFLRVFLSQAAAAAQQQGILGIVSPIEVDGWGLSDVEVVNERHYIDILALSESDGFACLIENKIFSPEGQGQLRGYLQTVEETYPGLQPFPVFLTPAGIAPAEEHDKNTLGAVRLREGGEHHRPYAPHARINHQRGRSRFPRPVQAHPAEARVEYEREHQ